MKIITIVGARPQFVKAAAVSQTFQSYPEIEEIILHTGQHFDHEMSSIFFDELGIPKPSIQLDINGGGHGSMTGNMLIEIENSLCQIKPDRVLVYGDTNSTLAGALAAIKLHIPVAHVEAGLRSFNMKMPEEVNRILTDQISDLLFCPTKTAINNLIQEGFSNKPVKIIDTGDVMQDAVRIFSKYAQRPKNLEFQGPFVLATLHRAENTDDLEKFRAIITSLNEIHRTIAPVLVPLHPRAKIAAEQLGFMIEFTTIAPVGYLEMLWLLQNCGLVLTDSGGLQKEAFFFNKYCLTLRSETEWVELLDIGVNELVGANQTLIVEAARNKFNIKVEDAPKLYGEGFAASKIADQLLKIS